MQGTILQASDIIRFTDVGKEFPLCKLREIYTTEYYEFVNTLGIAFYSELKAI